MPVGLGCSLVAHASRYSWSKCMVHDDTFASKKMLLLRMPAEKPGGERLPQGGAPWGQLAT
eukprot:8208443-Pyramimonas_sp.AAC.1